MIKVGMHNSDLVGYYHSKIVKSLRYLEFSLNRVQPLSEDPTELSEEQLEKWDGLAVRFARSSDLFLSKFITAVIKRDDPAFDGGFRDKLHQAEKLKVLTDIPTWMEIRQLRNVTVHEYSDSDLREIFKKLKRYSPLLLALEQTLPAFLDIEI